MLWSEGHIVVWEFEKLEVREVVVLESNIPGTVKTFHYAKNHHYLSLKDGDGNETTLLEHGVIAYTCTQCGLRWWTESNTSSVCPSCLCREITQVWVKPQVALIPEKESGFELVKKSRESAGGEDVQD